MYYTLKNKRIFLLFASMYFLLLTTSLYGQRSSTSYSVEPTYEYVYSEQMVTGGDEYNLFTRIYLPKGDGPWPVVITRTPYAFGRTSGDNITQGQEYAKRGLGYIVQYCRGKGGSEGTYKPNEFERADGIALVNWAAAQPWCKSIGIFGSSYTALTGWIIADKLPEKVKGLYLSHYGVDRFISIYKDGLFRQDILSGWAIDNAEEPIKKPYRDSKNPYYEQYRYMPQKTMDVDLLGAELPWYRDWITNTNYNDEYWNQGYWSQLKNIPPKINIPVTIVAGLYDHHMEGTILGYEKLNDETRKQSRLVLGSWNHSFGITPTQHSPEHASDFDINKDQFEWLYSVVAKETIPKGEVKVYFIEEDKWMSFDSWPVKSENVETYYFTKQINQDEPKAYILDKTNEAQKEKITYVYDPQNPVISNGGETLFNSTDKRGSKLQKEPGYRDDVISFISPVLKNNLTIAGKIAVKLNVSTDVDDTCFAFTVSEVMPDGLAYNIRSGITTLAYRNNSLGNRQTYTPNDIVEINIETLPITWNVKAGNRIRVDISSSNFPEYSIHSNYAGIWSLQTKTRVANQVVYIGGEYESKISISIIKF
ncbi:MAG: CocE/NonD family hydrolase [Sedimentisphaerales bacterium]|nr:CocE/NonD family hydrolase [Sedimentisphaerales bacterium]